MQGGGLGGAALASGGVGAPSQRGQEDPYEHQGGAGGVLGQELGGRVAYLETAEGGHAGRATSAVRARTSALIHEFAWRRTSG